MVKISKEKHGIVWSRPEIYFEATQQVERLKKLQSSAEAELEKKQLEKQNVSFRRIGESGFHREICILSGKKTAKLGDYISPTTNQKRLLP